MREVTAKSLWIVFDLLCVSVRRAVFCICVKKDTEDVSFNLVTWREILKIRICQTDSLASMNQTSRLVTRWLFSFRA